MEMSDETYEAVVPASVIPGLRVAILGAGKMGGILLQAFLKNNQYPTILPNDEVQCSFQNNLVLQLR